MLFKDKGQGIELVKWAFFDRGGERKQKSRTKKRFATHNKNYNIIGSLPPKLQISSQYKIIGEKYYCLDFGQFANACFDYIKNYDIFKVLLLPLPRAQVYPGKLFFELSTLKYHSFATT